MKYAVYVKFRRTDNGGDQWSGNQDRTDESREVAERATVENLKKNFPIERVLKVISFEYGDDEIAPSFCDMTERADKEARKEFALVEIADALQRIRFDLGNISSQKTFDPNRETNGFIRLAMIASVISVILSGIGLLLRLIL